MTLTREFLNNLGLTEAQIDAVLAAYAEDLAALSTASAAELPAAVPSGDGGLAERFDALQQAFDDYRAENERRMQEQSVRDAYRGLLARQNIDPRRLDVILRATRFDDMALDDSGRLADEDRLAQAIRRDWGDFIVTRRPRGANVALPPYGGRTVRTRDEIMAIPDTLERQRAIAENHELFGF